MPYRSDAQRRWAHTSTGTLALGGPEKVAEWDQESKGADLPEKINTKRRFKITNNPTRKLGGRQDVVAAVRG